MDKPKPTPVISAISMSMIPYGGNIVAERIKEPPPISDYISFIGHVDAAKAASEFLNFKLHISRKSFHPEIHGKIAILIKLKENVRLQHGITLSGINYNFFVVRFDPHENKNLCPLCKGNGHSEPFPSKKECPMCNGMGEIDGH